MQPVSVLAYRLTRGPIICLENKHVLNYVCLATGQRALQNMERM